MPPPSSFAALVSFKICPPTLISLLQITCAPCNHLDHIWAHPYELLCVCQSSVLDYPVGPFCALHLGWRNPPGLRCLNVLHLRTESLTQLCTRNVQHRAKGCLETQAGISWGYRDGRLDNVADCLLFLRTERMPSTELDDDCQGVFCYLKDLLSTFIHLLAEIYAQLFGPQVRCGCHRAQPRLPSGEATSNSKVCRRVTGRKALHTIGKCKFLLPLAEFSSMHLSAHDLRPAPTVMTGRQSPRTHQRNTTTSPRPLKPLSWTISSPSLGISSLRQRS